LRDSPKTANCIRFNTFDRFSWARMPRMGFLGAGIPTDFNAFLRIGADNRVALYTGKIEMGQGSMTSIPQLLAEELYVNYDAVDIVMGDTELCPWDAGTFGSPDRCSFINSDLFEAIRV